MQNIQWYPGHMTKAMRGMQEDIRLIDLVVEICDARIPVSSRNPNIDSLCSGKERIVLLNKADLADPGATEEWISYFREKDIYAAAIDARRKKNIARIDSVVEKAMEKKRSRDKRRGINPRPVRAMIAGIPNSGKSTFINTYAGGAKAKTGNRPGVTKGRQWIRPNKKIELLDTPGVLWPKFDDENVGEHLAFVGSIRDEVFEKNELVCDLLEFTFNKYPGAIRTVYDIDEGKPEVFVMDFARKFGCLRSGGEFDISKACGMILNDFRGGKWGRISLEFCYE